MILPLTYKIPTQLTFKFVSDLKLNDENERRKEQ